MLGRWNEQALEAEALLNRDRYRRLDAFLQKHGQAIRVAPDTVCGFVHGKAGVITLADGRKLGFIGSMNETRSGWQRHYEILWEDESPEGVTWIDAEFEFLWNAARPLPDAVIREVRRRGYRHEVLFDEIEEDEELAPAALIESPLYREGLSLQPWQQGFITECLRHYRQHSVVRLLLADEVGLGKTLSLGAAALALWSAGRQGTAGAVSCGDLRAGHAVHAVADRDDRQAGYPHRPLGHAAQGLAGCGGARHLAGRSRADRPVPRAHRHRFHRLMMRDSLEKQQLLGLRFGVVILDEAHRARIRQGFGRDAGTPNALLAFMREIAARADHVLLAPPRRSRPGPRICGT